MLKQTKKHHHQSPVPDHKIAKEEEKGNPQLRLQCA